MLLSHQTFMKFTKFKKYFCVQWQKYIQIRQTLLRFDLCKVLTLNPVKNFMAPFYGWGLNCSCVQSHYEEVVYFLPLSSQIFLVLTWSTSKGWKSELTLEPPSGFEHGTLGLGIQHLGNPAYKHVWAINIY